MAGGRIFINYRRDDSRADAGRIYDRLSTRFPGKVFRDVGSLEPGVEWHEAIQRVLGASDACVVVIGKSWLNLADAAGRRRLDDPNDTVRMEVRTALSHKMRVIPVLVGGASMPAEEELPEEIRSLARRNALQITEQDWDEDLTKLIRALEQVLGLPAEKEKAGQARASFSARFSLFHGRFAFAFVGTVALSLVLISVSVYNKGRGRVGVTDMASSPRGNSAPSESAPSEQDSPRESVMAEKSPAQRTESGPERSPAGVHDAEAERTMAAPPANAVARPAAPPDLAGSWQATAVVGSEQHDEEIDVYPDGSYAVNYASTVAAVGRWRYESATASVESEGVIIATGIKYACRLSSTNNEGTSFRGGCNNVQGLAWSLTMSHTGATGEESAVEVPGIDLTGLTQGERAAFLRLLESEPCLCGCGLNLLACRRSETEHCINSLRIAEARLSQFMQITRR